MIELRSKAPLLPLRIFRLRTLTASNVSGLLLAGAVFSQFFLLTLYMQQVLHYSALKTGVAYIALTLTIIAFSGVAQALVDPHRRPAGADRRARAVGGRRSSSTRSCRCDGHYFWDLFPAFMLSGIGLALAFVPMSIGALTGVDQSDAGVASGLINTSQQIGGAIGVAAATTIATTFTTHYVDAHAGVSALSGGRAHARLPDRVLRARRDRGRRRCRGGGDDGVAGGHRCTGRAGRGGRARAGSGLNEAALPRSRPASSGRERGAGRAFALEWSNTPQGYSLSSCTRSPRPGRTCSTRSRSRSGCSGRSSGR